VGAEESHYESRHRLVVLRWAALGRAPGIPAGCCPPRQHPLKGSLGSRLVDGTEMEQWQFEVTGGRIWYCIDDDRTTVWMTMASVGHPKATVEKIP
jgi:hypothetical protein